MASPARPFKVWNHNRTAKKAVIAASLQELLSKGGAKLGVSGSLRAVLEEDGTEVDEEDYFTFLPNNATIMLLASDQTWSPPGRERRAIDETDHGSGDKVLSERVRQLLCGLQHDLARIITFSNDDLQEIVDLPLPVLTDTLQETEVFAKALQEACQRHLDERQQTAEAFELLAVYQRARQQSPYVEADNKKRKVADSS